MADPSSDAERKLLEARVFELEAEVKRLKSDSASEPFSVLIDRARRTFEVRMHGRGQHVATEYFSSLLQH